MRRELTVTGLLLMMTGGCDGTNASSTHSWDDDEEDWSEDPDFEPGDGDSPDTAPPPRLFPTVQAARRPPALSGGTLTVSPDGEHAVAADPDRDQAYLIELSNIQVVTVPFAEGDEPGRVSFDAQGRAHVVLRGSGAVATLGLEEQAELRRAPVCQVPRGIAHHADKGSLFVACASGELVELDPENLMERSRVLLDRDLRDVVVDRAGDLMVSRFRSAELLQVRDGVIARRTRPPTITRARFDTIAFDDEGEPIELPPEVVKSPMQAWRMVTSPDGDVVTLHERGDDSEVVPAPGGYGGGGCDPIVETAVSRFDQKGQATSTSGMSGVAVGVDAAYSPEGWLAVAAPSSYLHQVLGTVMLYRASSAESEDSMDCGLSSEGMAAFSGQATAVAFDQRGRLLVQHREPAQLEVYELEDGDYGVNPTLRWLVPLADSSVRDTGHDLFHADVGAGVACMSCHGEAADDGHTWNFRGFGPRRTQSLGGGILSTAPFHWEGDMSSLRHLVDDVMVGRMGGFFVDDEQVKALGDWLDQQSALSLAASDEAAAQRGKVLFESPEVACGSCHAGPMLTNNTTVDVGTGGLFQVPSLRGLALRAPYMHDGCAATLRDRFDASCGGATHGNVKDLTVSQVDDLVAYLETL